MRFPANLFLTLFILIINYDGYPQAIDYSPAYRSMNSTGSFRFSYENDFFSASDRDYTQGVYLELIHTSLRQFPLTHLLWKPKANQQKFGIALETNGYTPNNIDKSDIQYNDRPYASALLIKTFNTAISSGKKISISNTITLGVLGPLAGGKEIQSSIHRWIGYTKPLGWHNQVKNEPVFNYQVNYEKALAGNSKNLLVTINAMMRAGTLSTKATVGPAVMLGRFQDPYNTEAGMRKSFDIYLYDHAGLNLVGYDATLQGGMINRGSPYTIPSADVKRLVFQNRFGLVVAIRKLRFEYWQSFLTKEYETGIEPKTGGVQIGFRL